MGDLTDSGATPPPAGGQSNPRPMPVREDCWSEEATGTLIEAWGSRYVELNRGNLRQKDWREVADTVNSLHGHSKKTYRTDVQCKNRIDTVKKKYKTEKARISASKRAPPSTWVFYDRLDSLIGPTLSGKKPSPPSPPISPPMALPLPYKKMASPAVAAAVSLPQKRPAERAGEDFFRRNYSEVAAAAAAAEAEADDDDEEREEDRDSELEEEEEDEEEDEGEGMKKLAKAIERFGEVYQRVEAEKLKQMMDLEKQRMQFAKDLEVQRLKMFMDTQVQLERVKHKRSTSDDTYS